MSTLVPTGMAWGDDNSPKDAPDAAAAPPPPECACTAAGAMATSAMDRTARALTAALSAAPRGSLVAVAPLTSDVEAPRADALAVKLASLVAGKLGAAASHRPAPEDLSSARLAAAGAPALIYLTPRIAGGRLHLEADAYPIPTTVWARARSAQPGPRLHAHSHAPLDAELRSYLLPLRFDEPVVHKYAEGDEGVLALACGDLDGDAVAEVVTVTRQRVLQVALRQGKVERQREARWDDVSPIAPVPLRQPLAFAVVVEGPGNRAGYLDVSLSDRRDSARLDAELRLQASLEGTAVPHAGASACSPIVTLEVGRLRHPCSAAELKPPLHDLSMRADAIASPLLVASDGSRHPVAALRRASDGALFVRTPEGSVVIGRVGAQLAAGDIDQDGALDLATTMDVLSAKHDALVVRTLLPSGTVKERFQLPVPSGIEALALCPPDGGGRAPLVLATGNEIWVVR